MVKCVELEKQEIIRCLEADKGVPEKYRLKVVDIFGNNTMSIVEVWV